MTLLNRFSRCWRKAVLISAGLFLFYVAFGFLLLPQLIHNTVTETLVDVTHRPVTLAELKINPLTLSATLRGLEIGTVEQPLASFEEIYVNFSSSSLWRCAIVFNRIRLQAPRAVIAIDREGRFNFQEMMPADEGEKSSAPVPVLVIESLEVLRAAIDFDDQSRRGVSEPVVVVPRLDVSGLHLDLSRRAVIVNDVTLKELQLHAVREADGQINLQTLFATEAAPEEEQGKPWQITLASVQLQAATLQFDDRTTRPAAQWRLTPFNLALHKIELGTDKPVELQLDSGINEGGSATVRGTVTLAPLSVNLDLKLAAFDLTAVQPYVQSVAQLQVRQGLLDVEGQLGFEVGETEPAIRFTGSGVVRQLKTVDVVRSEEFLKWEQLAINNLKYDSHVARLSIAELVLNDPYLRFIIGPDASTNFSHILAAPANVASATMTPAAEAKAAPLITIDRVSVANGVLNFSDQSIKPGFSSSIQQLNGSIRSLSSKALARADVDLKGKVNRYAPATISGKVNPLSDDAFTDLKLDFRGIEMTSFSPYSGKFAGYKIDKGKLNVELHYLLSKKELRGENKFVIDQLQLGEAVESPEASGLLVRLAIAILKDSKGVIDLDLPISGRIDDPDFHYGHIVWMALKNVIINVATEPFRALASLLGGNDEGADQVSFTSGMATLSAAEQAKLGNLARALSQRSALLLEVRGAASASDAKAMAAAALEQSLVVQPGESRPQKINALYLKRNGKAATTLLPPLAEGEKRTPEQLQLQEASAAEAQLLKSMAATEDELRALAQARAQAIIVALIEGEEKIAAERIFLLDPDTRAGSGETVVVPLSLKVR